MKETKEEKHKKQQKRIEYLSKEYGQKIEGLHKLEVEGLNRLKERLNQQPSKEFIEDLKSTSHYQVECPKCKMSNRKWLEGGENPYFYPIHRLKDNHSKKVKVGKQVLTQYFSYQCDLCNVIFE